MTRYWVSWYSGGYADEGCVEQPPFTYWWTGSRDRHNHGLTDEQYAILLTIEDTDKYYAFLDTFGKSDGTACACIDAESEDEIWTVIGKYFPDYEQRFIEEREFNYDPSVGGRFTSEEPIKTSLYEAKEENSN